MNSELDEFQPISPDQALEKQYQSVPYFAIKVINEILSKKYDGSSMTIRIHELVEKILAGANDREMNPGGLLAYKDLKESEIYDNKWASPKTLNAIFGPVGWKISGTYPDYTESFASYLTFEKK